MFSAHINYRCKRPLRERIQGKVRIKQQYWSSTVFMEFPLNKGNKRNLLPDIADKGDRSQVIAQNNFMSKLRLSRFM